MRFIWKVRWYPVKGKVFRIKSKKLNIPLKIHFFDALVDILLWLRAKTLQWCYNTCPLTNECKLLIIITMEQWVLISLFSHWGFWNSSKMTRRNGCQLCHYSQVGSINFHGVLKNNLHLYWNNGKLTYHLTAMLSNSLLVPSTSLKTWLCFPSNISATIQDFGTFPSNSH